MSAEQPEEWIVEFYLDHSGHSPVTEFLDRLDPKNRAGVYWAVDQLKALNIHAREPLVRHIEGKLWELRRKSKGGVYRLFYFFFTGRRIVFLHAFQKKTQKTPAREIEIARKRMTDYIEKKGGEDL